MNKISCALPECLADAAAACCMSPPFRLNASEASCRSLVYIYIYIVGRQEKRNMAVVDISICSSDRQFLCRWVRLWAHMLWETSLKSCSFGFSFLCEWLLPAWPWRFELPSLSPWQQHRLDGLHLATSYCAEIKPDGYHSPRRSLPLPLVPVLQQVLPKSPGQSIWKLVLRSGLDTHGAAVERTSSRCCIYQSFHNVCSIERRHSEGKKDVNRSHERKVASIDPADRNKFTFHEEEAISGMVLTHPSMYIVGIYRRNLSLEV